MLPGIVSLATIIHPFPDATEALARQFPKRELRIFDRVEIGINENPAWYMTQRVPVLPNRPFLNLSISSLKKGHLPTRPLGGPTVAPTGSV